MNNVKLGCCIIVLLLGISRSAASHSVIGVSPEDESYYKGLLSSSSAIVKCRDGSNKFSKSQLNDDFCDCPDGSDEPGTSACPNGKYYCKNAGHAPLSIYSSRVNDGICDCCDGSDEYDGKIKCVNTCWEAGKVAREKLRKKIATYQKGVTIRMNEIKQAKLSIAKEEGELSKLKDEEKLLKRLVEQLNERKEQIEKAEEKERLQKEKEEKEKLESQEAKEKKTKPDGVEPEHNDIQDDIGTISEPPQDSSETSHDSINEPEFSDPLLKDIFSDDEVEAVNKDSLQDENKAEETESLSREELGRRVASQWIGEKTEQHTEDLDVPLNKDHQIPDETPSEINSEEENSYDSEDDDVSVDPVDDFGAVDHYDSSSSTKPESDDELDLSYITGSSTWLKKIQKTIKTIFRSVNIFQKPVNISEAANVRKEYDESSAKLSKIQSRISSLTEKLKQDFGPEKEFYSFHGQCFETKQNKYTYKVCPFKQATQEEGYSTTRLGSWEKFEDSYKIMQFLNGNKCWNGPDRSLKVKLRCGLKNELTDVDEPSRCEYLALLSTPALCLDNKLKELQDKLESLNNDQPQGHDEL